MPRAVLLPVLLVCLAGFVLLLVTTLAPGRYEAFLARWSLTLAKLSGTRPGRAVRALRMVAGTAVWILLGLVVGEAVTEPRAVPSDPTSGSAPEWFVSGVLVWLAVTAVLVVGVLVVALSGRPRFLVIPQCRALSIAAADRWVLTQAGSRRGGLPSVTPRT